MELNGMVMKGFKGGWRVSFLNKLIVGIDVRLEKINLVVIQGSANKLKLIHIEQLDIRSKSIEQQKSQLQQALLELKQKHINSKLVINTGISNRYSISQTLSIDTRLSKNEVKLFLTRKFKGLAIYRNHNVIFDYCSIPSSVKSKQLDDIYVVTTKQEYIEQRQQLIGEQCHFIETNNLALVRAFSHFYRSQENRQLKKRWGLIYLYANRLVFIVVKNSSIFYEKEFNRSNNSEDLTFYSDVIKPVISDFNFEEALVVFHLMMTKQDKTRAFMSQPKSLFVDDNLMCLQQINLSRQYQNNDIDFDPEYLIAFGYALAEVKCPSVTNTAGINLFQQPNNLNILARPYFKNMSVLFLITVNLALFLISENTKNTYQQKKETVLLSNNEVSNEKSLEMKQFNKIKTHLNQTLQTQNYLIEQLNQLYDSAIDLVELQQLHISLIKMNLEITASPIHPDDLFEYLSRVNRIYGDSGVNFEFVESKIENSFEMSLALKKLNRE